MTSQETYTQYAQRIASRAREYGFILVTLPDPYGVIFENVRTEEFTIYPENEPEWGQPPRLGHDSMLMVDDEAE